MQAIKTGLEWFGLATTAAAFIVVITGTAGLVGFIIIGVSGVVAAVIGARSAYKQSGRDEAHAQEEQAIHTREVRLETALMDELQRHHSVEMKDESIETIVPALEHKEEKALPSNDRFFNLRRSITMPVQDDKSTDDKNMRLI